MKALQTPQTFLAVVTVLNILIVTFIILTIGKQVESERRLEELRLQQLEEQQTVQ
jgi:hypothetical protein